MLCFRSFDYLWEPAGVPDGSAQALRVACSKRRGQGANTNPCRSAQNDNPRRRLRWRSMRCEMRLHSSFR